MPLVEAARFANPVEADIARGLLADAGVESFVFDGQMSGYGLGGAIPVRLMVEESQLAHARALLPA